jgi:hypothetical protein
VVPWYIILGVATIMIIPIIYYICIVIWLPRNLLERVQYICGLFMYIFCGPFLNICVLLFAVHNMDSFGWGKTRKVVSEDTSEKKDVKDEESDVGMEKEKPSVKFGPEIVAILGCVTANSHELLERFGAHYRTIAYDTAEETMEELRTLFKGREDLTVEATSNDARLALANVFIITSPAVPYDSESSANMLYLHGAVKLAAKYARPGSIIIIESPIPVGTTRPLLRFCTSSGVHCGYAASASVPKETHGSVTRSKIFAARESGSKDIIETLYKRVFAEVTAVASLEVAEMLQLIYSVKDGLEDVTISAAEIQVPSEFKQLQSNLSRLTARWKALAYEVEDGMERLPQSPSSNFI